MDFESMNLVLKRKPTKRSTELEVNKKYPLLKMMVLDTKYGPNIKIATPEFFCFTPNRYYQYLKEPGVKTIQDMLNQGRSMGAVSKTLNTVPTMAHNGIRMIDTDDELDEKMRKFHTFGNTFCKIGEDNICMQICYQNWAEKLNKFEVRNDDIWVMGFPRSGTTWVQEMVWLIVNNLDYEGAKEDQSKRVPYFEMEAVFDLTVPNEQYNTSEALLPAATKLEYINKLKSPRMIKSHLHWSLLPEDITMGYKHPKIIYVLRNAKDVAISYYYLGMLTGIFTGSFEDFYELFLGDRIHYAPFWKVALSYWQHRHRPNFLFVRYKDMIDDLRSVIKQVAAFQGKELNDEQIEQLAEHLSFANMKNNRSVNPVDSVGQIPIVPSLDKREKYDFIRKGEQNGYIKEMSPEMIRKFDEWTKRQLEGTELVVD